MTAPRQVLMAAGGGIVGSFVAWDAGARGSPSGVTLNFNSDGTVTKTVTAGTSVGTNGSPNWWTPTTTGIGSRMWIFAQVTGGNALTIGTINAWLPLTSGQSFGHLSGTQDSSATITFHFSTAASGTPEVMVTAGNKIRRGPNQ
jgi:hypothetical protein